MKSVSNVIVLVAWAILIAACRVGGDDGNESRNTAWVRIDSPVDGEVTARDSIWVEGNAGTDDGSNPGRSIHWFNNGASGGFSLHVSCLIFCIGAFQGAVPLFLGTNIITVQLLDGSDSVTVTHEPRIFASGSVVMVTGAPVSDVTITLSGDADLVTTTSEIGTQDQHGEYFFLFLNEGSYNVSASLPPPQSSDCLSFTPDHYAFEIINFGSHFGLHFTASQLTPCYEISGHISRPNGIDSSSDKITLKDIDGNLHVLNPINLNGNYYFRHLGPGTYTVIPSGVKTYTPETITITITDSSVTSIDFIKSF